MRTVRIAPIVEGDGEATAFPVLLRRIVGATNPTVLPEIARSFKHPSGSLRRVGGVERAVEAVARLHRGHSIIVLIDSDDDCPKELGAILLNRARRARSDVQVSVILAHREYETWFLCAAESLAGKRNFRNELATPANAEDIRDAKGWISRNMLAFGIYRPTQDQAALSQIFDIEMARTRSRSLRKLWREVEAITVRSAD